MRHHLPVLVLSRRDVERLLDLDLLVDALAEAMADLSRGSASMPPRTAARTPEGGLLGVMPAFLPSSGALTTKLVTLFESNAGTDLPTHQAAIVVFDPNTGTPIALMDGTHITATRTAAGSALATRLLARRDASVLAILGTGVQADSHARAVVRVRPIREVRIAGRDPERARALAARLSPDLGVEVRAVASNADALAGADVACGCTHAADPVIRRAWLSPGVHVNSVGLNGAGREVDADTVRDALVVVEHRRSVLGEFPAGANDLAWPIRDGVITDHHIHAEIGELVSGSKPARTSREQITLYKSVGVAVQDAAAAALVLRAAREHGAGETVDL
jgi:ornithine cyclodeaminase/alanine dehydrogenase-like protein (mu-crystallin family)